MADVPTMITKQCEGCGAAVTRRAGTFGKGRVFCSRRCAYDARIKAKPTTRRVLYRPNHPLAGVTGLVQEHRAVLWDKIGLGPHPCHWCGKEIDWLPAQRGSHAGRIVADHVDMDGFNNAPENLVPSCQNCNIHREGKRQYVADDEVFAQRPDGSKRRGVEKVCPVCGTTFIATASPAKKNAGTYCSRQCLYNRNRR